MFKSLVVFTLTIMLVSSSFANFLARENDANPDPAKVLQCINDVAHSLSDVTGLVADVQKGDWQAAIQALPAVVSDVQTVVTDCSNLSIEHFEGHRYGNIITCVKDAMAFVSEAKTVVDDFQKGDTAAAIQLLPELLKTGAAMVNDCKSITQ